MIRFLEVRLRLSPFIFRMVSFSMIDLVGLVKFEVVLDVVVVSKNCLFLLFFDFFLSCLVLRIAGVLYASMSASICH